MRELNQKNVNFDEFLSKSVQSIKTSMIRDILKLTENKKLISFAGGLPDPDTFPDSDIKKIVGAFTHDDLASALQYGATPGMTPLRKELIRLLSLRGISNVDESNVLVSTGSQEALYMLAFLLLNPMDDVIVEAPSYIAALNAIRLRDVTFHGVPLDDDGMNLEALDKELSRLHDAGRRAKFIYTIPTSQNPGGITMSLEKRKGLLDIARKYDTLIIEDDAYGFISFGEAPAAIKSFDTEGRVIYLSTFSKILAPGFRLGWAVANSELIRKIELLKQSVDLHTSTFNQAIALKMLRNGVIERNIPKIKKLYKKKSAAMVDSIKKWFPKNIRYSKPQGGMFVFVWLDEKVDTDGLLKTALEHGVAFVPGSGFYHDGSGKNTMRLNFSEPSIDDIKKGIKLLGELIKNA